MHLAQKYCVISCNTTKLSDAAQNTTAQTTLSINSLKQLNKELKSQQSPLQFILHKRKPLGQNSYV